jgi:hypothetical protein
MNTHFFEEFPTIKNLNKLSLITWKHKLFLAAHSYKEFLHLQNNIKQINKKTECIYWPILQGKEGYWISPFSKTSALKRIFQEIPNNQPIMLDLELPFRHPWRFLTTLPYFIKNKSLIKKFFHSHKHVYTAEYAVLWLSEILGVSYCDKKHPHTKIFMYYTSMLSKHHTKWFVENSLPYTLKHTKKCMVGLGTIAIGILGNEPILSPNKLKEDIQEMKKLKVKDIIIFRLGGLNASYINAIKK